MTGTSRALAFSAALVAGIAGLALALAADGAGFPLLLLALAIVVGVVFEPRYRSGRIVPDAELVDWQRTGEKFVDTETGRTLEVWTDPLTGARCYAPLGHDPRAIEHDAPARLTRTK
jgi:hypothetical protein